MTDAIVARPTDKRRPRRARLHRRRRHGEERAAPVEGRAERRHAAQDHRQRPRRDRRDHRVRDGAGDRDRGDRPAAQHRAQPPPDHRGRDHGPRGRLARRSASGLAGGADVDPHPGDPVPRRRGRRRRSSARLKAGTNFSIVAVAEGARRVEDAKALVAAEARRRRGERTDGEATRPAQRSTCSRSSTPGNTLRLAHQLEQLTGLESRVSILGYIQRGGTPSPLDRLLATRVGAAAADLVAAGTFGVMVAARGDAHRGGAARAGRGQAASTVPPDHPWIVAARHVGTCLGD